MESFVPAAPNTLQIDIDDPADFQAFTSRLHNLIVDMEAFTKTTITGTTIAPSKRPGHYHVTVTLSKRLPVMERIALQAILGSDRNRELHNWLRARRHAPHPIIFFEE